MCTGLEIAALIGSAASAAGAIHTMTQKVPTPQIQAPQKPPTPKQDARTADRSAALAGNAAAAMPGGALSGNKGTFLTGPGGVDASSLNLGKNTLLGQ